MKSCQYYTYILCFNLIVLSSGCILYIVGNECQCLWNSSCPEDSLPDQHRQHRQCPLPLVRKNSELNSSPVLKTQLSLSDCLLSVSLSFCLNFSSSTEPSTLLISTKLGTNHPGVLGIDFYFK